MISCRIEWSIFQVHSTKHAQLIVFSNGLYHKAIVVVFQPQGVNVKSTRSNYKISIIAAIISFNCTGSGLGSHV